MPTFRDNLHLGDKDPVIDSDSIADGAITTDKIEDQAITHDKMDCNSVGACQIIDNEVTLEKLSPDVRGMLQGAAGDYSELEAKIDAVDEKIDGYQVHVDMLENEAVRAVTLNGNIFLPDAGIIHLNVPGGGGGGEGEPDYYQNHESRLQAVEGQVYLYNTVNGERVISGFRIPFLETAMGNVEHDVDALLGKADGIKQVVFLDYKSSDTPTPVEGKYWLDDSSPALYKGVVEDGTLKWKLQKAINGKLYVHNNVLWRINNDEVERLYSLEDDADKAYLDKLYIHRETGKLYWMGNNFSLSEVKPWVGELPTGESSGVKIAYVSSSDPTQPTQNPYDPTATIPGIFAEEGEYWFDHSDSKLYKRTDSETWVEENITKDTLFVGSKGIGFYDQENEEGANISPWTAAINQAVTALRKEIAEAAGTGHQVIILAFCQAEDITVGGNAALALRDSMPHGIYWMKKTKPPVLYKGTYSQGSINWNKNHPVPLSQETLYVDRNGKKSYVYMGGELVEVGGGALSEKYAFSIKDPDSLITSIEVGGTASTQGQDTYNEITPISLEPGTIVKLYGSWSVGDNYRYSPLAISGINTTYEDAANSFNGKSYYYFPMPKSNLQITVADINSIIINTHEGKFDTATGNVGAFTIVTEQDGITTKPENIVESNVRSAARNAVTPLHMSYDEDERKFVYDVPIGPGTNNENIGSPHIWTASEVGLQAEEPGDGYNDLESKSLANVDAIRNALDDDTCIGIKLDTLYQLRVGHNVQGEAPSYYKAVDIVLPRDFILDGTGQVEDPETHQMVEGAVGGFIVRNGDGNMFYTEYSLNLRNLVTKVYQSEKALATYYVYANGSVNGVPHGVDQLIVDGCVFDGYDTFTDYGRNYVKVHFATSVAPIDSRGYPKEQNYINHILVKDCTCHGGGLLYNNGTGRVDESFCIIGNTITGIQDAGIYWNLDDSGYCHDLAYMMCPMYIVGNTFEGKGEIWREHGSNGVGSYYTAVLAEVAEVYMLHNNISQFVAGASKIQPNGQPYTIVDQSSAYYGNEHMVRPATYDAYLSCRQVHYCNNVVENVLVIDTVTTGSGVMKAKHASSPGLDFWHTFYDKDPVTNQWGSVPSNIIRPAIRHFIHNNYSIDVQKVKTLWNTSRPYRDGYLQRQSGSNNDHSEEIAWDNSLDPYVQNGSLLCLQFNGQPREDITMKEVVISDNTFNAGSGNISGISLSGQRWFCSDFILDGNTFTAARMTSIDWRPKNWGPDSGANYTINEWLASNFSGLCLFGAVFKDFSNDHPLLKVTNNDINLTGESTRVVLFARDSTKGYTGDLSVFGTEQEPSVDRSGNTITAGGDIFIGS